MIKFYSKIIKLSPRRRIRSAWKVDESIEYEYEEQGWFMLLEGSWEALYVGNTQPDGLKVGDEVEVIIRIKS